MTLVRRAPRVIVSGEYMARPSVRKQAVRDFAFAIGPSPMIVVRGEDGAPLVSRTVDALHADYRAMVIGLSISYATPPPMPEVPDDDTRRDGGPFAADVGFFLQRPNAPRALRVHAEFGPLRSNEVIVRLRP